MDLKPTIVLAAVTTVVSALLIVAHNLTYVDTSGIITPKLGEKCVSLMGEGEYTIVTDWLEAGYATEKPDCIEKLILGSNGSTAFEIIADGYNKGGLPIIFNFNNNHYGMGGQTRGETMAYGDLARLSAIAESQMEAERINGWNPLAVIDAYKRKIKAIKEGKLAVCTLAGGQGTRLRS